MVRALAGRVVGGIVLILLLTLMSFAVWALIPRSVNLTLSLPPGWTQEQKADALRRVGLDRPLYEQWGDYVWSLGTRGDFGDTLSLYGAGGFPVRGILLDALPATLSLALGGFVLALVLAIPLGLVSALRRGTAVDRGILFFTVFGIALHPFIVGLILAKVVADKLGLAPDGGYCPLRGETEFYRVREAVTTCGGVVDWATHLWLPWVTFALFFVPIYARLIRTRLVETLGEQYVLTARAKGASERQVLARHVLRPGLAPLAAMVAVDAGTMIAAAIYVETIFSLNGIGMLVVHNLSGIFGYDRNTVVGVVVFAAIAITIANLLADMTMRGLDPRLRATGKAF
jgi:peptide/nickel transport system permease protein